MAENFELNNRENQAPESGENRLVNEGIEMSHLKGATESVKERESFERAADEVKEQIASLAERVTSLPGTVRESFLDSISDRTGDEFPAYDLMRAALKRKA